MYATQACEHSLCIVNFIKYDAFQLTVPTHTVHNIHDRIIKSHIYMHLEHNMHMQACLFLFCNSSTQCSFYTTATTVAAATISARN